MAYIYKIQVTRSGRPAKGVRVTLCSNAMLGGMSSPERTDSEGVAVIKLDSSSNATVFVDGAKKGTVKAGANNLIQL